VDKRKFVGVITALSGHTPSSAGGSTTGYRGQEVAVIADVRSRLRRTRHWVRQHLEVVVNEHGTSDQHAMLAKGEQGLLFDPEITALPDDVGYRGPTACAAAGITYRQLDYWARTGLVEPSIRPAHGSGSQRLYGFRDILVLKIVKRLLDAGISLQQIRQAVGYLRHRGIAELATLTLVSDGATVYECASPGEVVDILAGGQGVFGIAVGKVWREVEGSLAELPGERPADEVEQPDEQAARRAARRTG
jgi:DNA-binding transcriptional MerR regulator